MKNHSGKKEKNEDLDPIFEYLKSDKFREDFKRQVELDTWGNDLPKIYMDDNGDIIEHWKDGTKKILKSKKNG